MSADLSRRAMMTAAASIAATPVVAVLPANQPAPPAQARLSRA
jgi:hypothetical protein